MTDLCITITTITASDITAHILSVCKYLGSCLERVPYTEMLIYICLVCVSKERLNLSRVFKVMDAVHIILLLVMFSGITSVNESSENILVQYTNAKVQFLCVAFILVSAFSSAFQIPAYPQHLIEFSSLCVFVYLPLSNRAGLGDGDRSSAFG